MLWELVAVDGQVEDIIWIGKTCGEAERGLRITPCWLLFGTLPRLLIRGGNKRKSFIDFKFESFVRSSFRASVELPWYDFLIVHFVVSWYEICNRIHELSFRTCLNPTLSLDLIIVHDLPFYMLVFRIHLLSLWACEGSPFLGCNQKVTQKAISMRSRSMGILEWFADASI